MGIKMKKNLRYVLFNIENSKKIVVEKKGELSQTFEDFCNSLPNDSPRYAVVEYEYKSEDGRDQSKLIFVFWSPDELTTVKEKMLYASSKDAIKKKLSGIHKEVQANDRQDLDP